MTRLPHMPPIPHHPARRFDAVLCDLDGCLSPETTETFDLESLARIAEHNERAQSIGDVPIVTLCTGRPLPFAEAMARLLQNRTMPIIAENGAWLWWPADNTYDRDPAIEPAHMHAVHEASEWMEQTFGPRGVVQQPGKMCSISLYHDDTSVLHEIEPVLRDEFARRGWPIRVSMTWYYINCDLEHVSKSSAIRRWRETLGFHRNRLAGIGDTAADSKIADEVSWFACPGNAQDAIKARADFVAGAGVAEGVVEILGMLGPR